MTADEHGAAGPPPPIETSAGGVVMRADGAVIAIVPRRRAGDGSKVLGLPKGHLDPGESALQAAVREVREEAGVEVEPIAEIGEVGYTYAHEGRPIPKRVIYHLFGYISGDIADHDHEVEQVRWMPAGEAAASLTYAGEREMVQRARELMRRLRPAAAGPAGSGEVSGEREER